MAIPLILDFFGSANSPKSQLGDASPHVSSGLPTILEPSPVSPLKGTSPIQSLDPSSLPERYNSTAIFGELSSFDLLAIHDLENRVRPSSELTY